MAHPDCATLSPSKPASQSDLAGLHRPAWTRRPWGGLGRSQRCTGRVADSDLHCKRQFTRAARRPQRPALAMRRLRVHTRWATRRLVLRPRPSRDPGRQTRARCACRAALGRRVSNSAPPPSMGHAPIPPDSSISKSTPRDLDFECPAVAFKIERAKCQLGSPGQASMTKGSFRHGFEFCTEWCRPSCSTWKF